MTEVENIKKYKIAFASQNLPQNLLHNWLND